MKVDKPEGFFLEFEEGKMMKKVSVSISLVTILCSLIFWLAGCSCPLPRPPLGCEQPGETRAEGHRRHKRNFWIERQEMMEDLDKVFLTDRPSKLSDRRIP